ncbi:helix-turn-helix transcriptional regulator [Microcoleus sp. D2_18a_D3]|jgi:DNA-binding transcriptional regulator YiaG|uniref:helix-turn-helix transcriptional regulator n=1 Tax=Microcoleus sp. D2_18a_D3 TaxID=3055330 RepID=UPI002FCED526
MKEGSKYQSLLDYLRENRHLDEVTLNFAEIEALLNDALPPSARTQQAWWSNRKKGALQATAWMEAGYRVETVDLDSQRVTFRKLIPKIQVRQAGDGVQWNGELIKALRLHMGLTQAKFAQHIGVRQATVSDWENGQLPARSTSKHLDLIAEMAGFKYREESENSD